MTRARAASAALAAAIAIALVSACGGGDKETTKNGATASSSSASSSSASTGSGGAPPAHSWTECQASDQAWVRRAIFALEGRRPWGQAEVDAYEDLVAAVRKADGAKTSDADPSELEHAKQVAATAMTSDDAYRLRWSDFLLDALHVNRVEGKSQVACYGAPQAKPVDGGDIAAFVRDHDPRSASAPPKPGFTAGDLVSSALALDDLSVVYRANVFAMLWLPTNGANVDQAGLEQARREDFGAVFDSAYLHRDLVCLQCHNSEFSVTFDEDPAQNRWWPVPGYFEKALYGASNGQHDPKEAATKGSDALRAISMLKYAGFADGSGKSPETPWGWDANDCGFFTDPGGDPLLSIDTYFGSMRGEDADGYDLEAALHRGVDRLAAHGLTRTASGDLADADEAFAYMVAENVVEKVWNEVMGTPLTIANYFPRSEVQRDVLFDLTEHFVRAHFSLKTLLFDILAHPAFNLKSPDEGCGDAPYELPNIFSPWTVSDSDLGKRGNSLGDGVFAVSSRPLQRSLETAMGWPFIDEYPSTTDEDFEVAIGFFIKDGEPGFRGLDFQGRLTWENVYGKCALQGASDFITELVANAGSSQGATVQDAVVALKDRLVGAPSIDAEEAPMLEALMGDQLASTTLTSLDADLRKVCGALVSSPQFMLGGVPPKDTRAIPKLTPTEVSYPSICAALSAALSASYSIECDPTSLSVKKP